MASEKTKKSAKILHIKILQFLIHFILFSYKKVFLIIFKNSFLEWQKENSSSKS